ncbi:lipid A deacylase LpxR family protein [Sphingobacterium lumbrici]|uniref:lipid A deacylase LpxR family protein n=1 Tax=Sphingobacterium lumbrici TaxID=2559600 RepID=UPI00112B9585|nr:lipid A deacylase LpxR family protein [Sphingobacterium lumbrici]
MYNKVLLAILSLLMTYYGAISQEYKNEFGIVSDNDAYLWYGQDRYYTNGLFIYYRRAIDQDKLKGNLEKLTYELSVGQKMYTPLSGYGPDPRVHDRPFAGYLYGKAQVNLFYQKEQVWKVGLALGTSGPNSLASGTQNLIHATVGLYETSGWDYQIQNEAAANLDIQYTALLHRNNAKSVDFSLESYAQLGTVFNGAGLALVFRTGHINQLFHSSYHNARISQNSKTKQLYERELYFYARPQFNYVAYDATIQGSLFTNNSPVTFSVRPFVFEQKVGVNYSTARFTLDYSLTFRAREIKSNARPHQYGSITAYYRFN